MRALLATLVGAVLTAGCGVTEGGDGLAPARVKQSVRASVRSTVVTGTLFTLTLRPNGTVWGWGSNIEGQLGDGTTTNRCTPVQVQGLPTSIEAIEAGGTFGLALLSDGTVWAWGANGKFQLGDTTTIRRTSPVQVQGLSGTPENPITPVALSAGNNHSLALMSDGTVRAWGDNYYGQLGDGTSINRSSAVQVPGLTNVVAIAARADHSLAVRSDGTLWAWGKNNLGQLGDGTTTKRTSPVQVQGSWASNLTVVDASGGNNHSVALLSNGDVWAWGHNQYGQLGDGTGTQRFLPVKTSISNVAYLKAAHFHNVAVLSDGSLWGWGYDDYSQGGGTGNMYNPTPTQMFFTDVASATAAGGYTVVERAQGDVWIWGHHSSGCLYSDANGVNVSTSGTPHQMQGLP